MKRIIRISLAAAAAVTLSAAPATAQRPHLHVHSRWEECSFKLAPSLTRSSWRQFTGEAGLVTYFRPLADARPMGKGNFELSILQGQTSINDADDAWNDTFVHPDSTHYLVEGEALSFPGLMGRVGLGAKTDVAGYFTKAPKANYGFYGVQVQRVVVGGPASAWNAATRVSVVSMFGPEDLSFAVAGADLVASRRISITRSLAVSPYASVSGYLARSHERTSAVALADAYVPGAQASVGLATQLRALRIGAEYNAAKVRSVSMKVGVGF